MNILIKIILLFLTSYCFADNDFDYCDTDKDGRISGGEQYLCQYSEENNYAEYGQKSESISSNIVINQENINDFIGAPNRQYKNNTQRNEIAVAVERDSEGHIKRSEEAKNDFKASHPCPANGNTKGSCPGYVIDHINPLACGGADSPINMQWQTIEAGKNKDKWERDNCVQQNPVAAYKSLRRKGGNVRHYESIYGGSSSNYGGSESTVYTGPRGGHYTINSNGNKSYIRH